MKLTRYLALLGPGFVVAATGLGAGDLVAATVSGAKLGTAIIWAVIVGAVLKAFLNEGLARWQLVTGSTLIEGWRTHLPRWVNYYFLVYLLLWSLLVSAALMAACGLAAHALMPMLSVKSWALLHSLMAVVLVLWGRYALFESVMKALIALMFVTVVASLAFVDLSGLSILEGLIPRVPEGEWMLVLGVIGGVGGSVTLLCYGYWMREKGWQDQARLPTARLDVVVAYSLTAMFAVAVMLLAAKAQPESVKGTQIILALANELQDAMGELFKWLFLFGFWGAVFSSMLGVWQGVPYLFADFVACGSPATDTPEQRRKLYRGFLFFLALPPFLLLLFGKPVWLVLVYSAAGALFMPFLAATLLYLNNRRLPIANRNHWVTNVMLLIALGVFVVLAWASL